MLPGSPQLQDLTNGEQTWAAFRTTLRPYYGVVWRDIALCYVMLAGGLVLFASIAARVPLTWEIPLLVLFSIFCGYWLHALMLFGHEAAHMNVAPKYNDRISDWTVWLPFGLSTARYRSSHWEHHLHLGDHDDTEFSYRNCMQPSFLLQLVTGIYFISLLRAYQGDAPKNAIPKKATIVAALLRTLVFHCVILAGCFYFGAVSTAIMWVVSTFVFFPFFATMRQILEHRIAEAACDRDFTTEEHGPVNRLFGTDLLSRYFGAAGFNRHLLHHWDPLISYTRFDDMEQFLLKTEIGSRMNAARSTYGKTLLVMLRSAWHG